MPGAVAQSCLTPGMIASEAGAVLAATGERDLIADFEGRAVRAYLSVASVDFYVCSRMDHMHNFATTRSLPWRRIES